MEDAQPHIDRRRKDLGVGPGATRDPEVPDYPA